MISLTTISSKSPENNDSHRRHSATPSQGECRSYASSTTVGAAKALEVAAVIIGASRRSDFTNCGATSHKK